MRTYYVYIIANASRQLYVGVTSDLTRRIWEHRHGVRSGFAHRYRITRLVHFETFTDARSAIAREKYLKGRHRAGKVYLIERHNPGWLDQAAFWFDRPGAPS